MREHAVFVPPTTSKSKALQAITICCTNALLFPEPKISKRLCFQELLPHNLLLLLKSRLLSHEAEHGQEQDQVTHNEIRERPLRTPVLEFAAGRDLQSQRDYKPNPQSIPIPFIFIFLFLFISFSFAILTHLRERKLQARK
jgi:hypothetical protein